MVFGIRSKRHTGLVLSGVYSPSNAWLLQELNIPKTSSIKEMMIFLTLFQLFMNLFQCVLHI